LDFDFSLKTLDWMISELLKPFDPSLMRCYPVSTRINHVANDDEESSRPVEPVVGEQKSPSLANGRRTQIGMLPEEMEEHT
jgi:hypothetical protein